MLRVAALPACWQGKVGAGSAEDRFVEWTREPNPMDQVIFDNWDTFSKSALLEGILSPPFCDVTPLRLVRHCRGVFGWGGREGGTVGGKGTYFIA